MKNKLIFTLLAMLCNTATCLAYDFYSQTKLSVEEVLDSVKIYYHINPDGKTVSVTIGPEAYKFHAVRIPETVTHNNTTYTVTEIAANAFAGDNIDIVQLPNSVTKIHDGAFSSCTLDSIKFSQNLKSIGEDAFWYNNLTTVYLPEGLETIGNDAFAHDTNWGGYPMGRIREIHLPASLKELGEGAFRNNDPLNNIIIPDNITEIPNSCFAGCTSLDNVTLSKNLRKIGDNAFRGTAFTELNEAFFPATLTEIGLQAFSRSKLKKVVLPNHITTIGGFCFYECNDLESISFSSGMTEVADGICNSCEKLVDITIPASIIKIGERAFSSTERLSHISLPESITEIGNHAFAYSGLVSFTVPPKVTTISSGMLYDCPYLEEVNLHNGITSIEPVFLEECIMLKAITIPEGVTEIPSNFANSCTALEEVNLPKSITTIGRNALYKLSALKSITLYHNIKSIMGGVLSWCDALDEIHIKTAIPPKLSNGYNFSQTLEHCTLYVPTGSKAAYEATSVWNAFDSIVEEEVGYDILYRVSATKTGKGGITINGQNTTTSDILSGSKVTVGFTPDDGWKLQQVNLNGKDITAELSDNGIYEIEDLAENKVFAVTFEELPAILQLRSADGGTIDMEIAKGNKFTCKFTPDDGWTINNVRYNNRDVTTSVDEANRYTTPAIKADAILSVAFENTIGGTESLYSDRSHVIAYITSDGTLVVEGADDGETITVVSSDGKIAHSLIANGGRASCRLNNHGVYIINTARKVIKTGY